MFLLGAIFHTPATEIRDTGNRILILARGDEADKSMASWGCVTVQTVSLVGSVGRDQFLVTRPRPKI